MDGEKKKAEEVLNKIEEKAEAAEMVSEESQQVQEEKPAIVGLTTREAEERIADGRANRMSTDGQSTLKSIILSNVLTYFNLIFLIISILLIMVGSFSDLTFLPIIVGNTLIGIFQEWSSKKTLDKITILNSPRTDVLRDGAAVELPSEDLVLDDVVQLGPGKQIPADAVVLEGEVLVNESLLTGESEEIKKAVGDELMSGSFIVSGHVKARLTAVGDNSFAASLTAQAKAKKKGEESEMIRSLDYLVRFIGIIIIPIAGVLFWQMYKVNGLSFREAVTSTVAAIIGMIPEGLYLLASVTMAASVGRLAMNKVLVHDMKSIESLARVDVLCVDKTGTITESTVVVTGFEPIDMSAPEEEEGDGVPGPEQNIPDKNPRELEDHAPKYPAALIETMLSDYVAAQNIDNETMKAMRARFKKTSSKKADRVIPFSSAWKYSATVFGKKTYISGAPEFLLGANVKTISEQIEKHAEIGQRVLLFGVIDGVLEKGQPLTDVTVEPICLVIAQNKVRESAPSTFTYFAKKGVAVKVISGDNPLTVSRVAAEAGIENADQYIDATTLLTDQELDASVDSYTVFGRVKPEQKQFLVNALKKRGHKVAMTGDGVNDVPALRQADCSIAMASGSEAAAHAAQMVLLDSDFSRLPAVVSEGRRVVNNIERTATLFLVKNIFSLLMSLFSILFMVNYPLKPTQISLVSAFTIGLPAFLLSMEQDTRPISGRFMKNVLYRAFPAGLTDFIVISALVVFCDVFDVKKIDLSTSCAILLAVVGLMILNRIMQPMNKYHQIIQVSMAIGIILSAVFLKKMFRISMPSTRGLALTILFAVVAEPCFRYLTRLFDIISKEIGVIRDNFYKTSNLTGTEN